MTERTPDQVINEFRKEFGEGEAFAEVMELLVAGAEEIVPVLKESRRPETPDQWESLTRAAHRCANFGSAVNDSQLNTRASQLERMARSWEFDEISDHVEWLVQRFRSLAAIARRYNETEHSGE